MKINLKGKIALILVLLVVPALVITGCGEGEEEKTVTVYTHNDEPEMQAFIEALEEQTGIQAEILRMSSGELWSRLEAEAPDFGADMVWGMMHSYALRAEEEGILHPYESPTWEDIPDEFKDAEGRWYGWSYWYNMIAVNEDLIEEAGYEPPESWEDLLDPKWENEIIAPDPGTSGTAYLIVSTLMQLMGEEEAWDYLRELNQNVDHYSKSGTAPAQMVAEGEFMIGLSWDMGVLNRQEEGYPIIPVVPSEGVGYDLDVAWILEGAENLETAKEVIDWIGSEEGMKVAHEHRDMVTREEVMDVEFEANFIDYDAAWAADNRDRIMEEWRQTFDVEVVE